MAVQFAVLASGSRGNSTLVRDRVAGFLIDVGIGPKEVGQRLESVGSDWSEIAAAALTHTHADHVDSATFSELARRGILLYCHEGHRPELVDKAGFQKLEKAALVRYYDDSPFMTTTGLRLEPIRLRHDGGPTYGFRIEASAERKRRPVSIGYVADTGTWWETMADTLADVEVLGVEFNHDPDLQESSGRPPFLIRRNMGDDGHLSNGQAADLVKAVLERSRRNVIRHLVLLHLSEQCNQPELAIDAAREVVRFQGVDLEIHAARQSPAHPNLWVDSRARTPRFEVMALSRAGSKARRRHTTVDSAGSMGVDLLDLIDRDDDRD